MLSNGETNVSQNWQW